MVLTRRRSQKGEGAGVVGVDGNKGKNNKRFVYVVPTRAHQPLQLSDTAVEARGNYSLQTAICWTTLFRGTRGSQLPLRDHWRELRPFLNKNMSLAGIEPWTN